jgi:hypothetical protein
MMMQYIRTKPAEEKWSLHQYNFLADGGKAVPHTCHLEDWIKIPTQTVADFRMKVKATVRIFSSRTDLPQSFLATLLAGSQRLFFRHQLCTK